MVYHAIGSFMLINIHNRNFGNEVLRSLYKQKYDAADELLCG